jgi:transposase
MGSRKQFTPKFKREAVQLLEGGGRPASAMARELGIARNQLYKWQTELWARGNTAFPGLGARKERTTEVARLKRELARVTEERDILKKSAAGSGASPGISCDTHVSSAAGEPEWVLCLATAWDKPTHTGQPAAHRADARPPSADARSLRGAQDVAAAES